MAVNLPKKGPNGRLAEDNSSFSVLRPAEEKGLIILSYVSLPWMPGGDDIVASNSSRGRSLASCVFGLGYLYQLQRIE